MGGIENLSHYPASLSLGMHIEFLMCCPTCCYGIQSLENKNLIEIHTIVQFHRNLPNIMCSLVLLSSEQPLRICVALTTGYVLRNDTLHMCASTFPIKSPRLLHTWQLFKCGPYFMHQRDWNAVKLIHHGWCWYAFEQDGLNEHCSIMQNSIPKFASNDTLWMLNHIITGFEHTLHALPCLCL